MDIPQPATLDAAEEMQSRLSSRVDLRGAHQGAAAYRTVAVLAPSPKISRGTASVRAALLEFPSGKLLGAARVSAPAATLFPFVPGLEGFRWGPLFQDVLSRLPASPDVLMVEGSGVAHRRRFGLACHLGLATDRPAFGVSSVSEIAHWDSPPPGLDGAHVFVREGGEILGLAVRVRAYRPPVFLSAGHKIGLMPALDVLWGVLAGGRGEDPFWSLRRSPAPARRKKKTDRPAPARRKSKKKKGARS